MNKQAAELEYLTEKLLPELKKQIYAWNGEYQGVERDLGVRASFAEVWRKAKKVKSIVWDGADDSTWREGLRTILLEIIGHALLMIFDIDHDRMLMPPSRSAIAERLWCGAAAAARSLDQAHDEHAWGVDPQNIWWCDGEPPEDDDDVSPR